MGRLTVGGGWVDSGSGRGRVGANIQGEGATVKEEGQSRGNARTLSAHAHFETLFESAVLALVPMVLVDGAVSVASTRVREVPSHRAFEEGLAALAGELAVVFARALVAAHDALDVGVLSVLVRRR